MRPFLLVLSIVPWEPGPAPTWLHPPVRELRVSRSPLSLPSSRLSPPSPSHRSTRNAFEAWLEESAASQSQAKRERCHSEPGRGEGWRKDAVGMHRVRLGAVRALEGMAVPAPLGARAARLRGREPGEPGGSAELGQRRQHAGSGAGGDTNLWPRSPGCVRGKLLARDTGREKRNRESEEGCDSPGVLQDKEGTAGHIPSRRQGVTAWERPAAPGTSTEPLSALQGRDVARGALHPNPCSVG